MSEQPFFFNPLAPEMAVDPYPHYKTLRETDPVHLSFLTFWFLTRHADVSAFFAEKKLEHRYVQTQTMRFGDEVAENAYFAKFRKMVFVLDDPDHRRVRRLLVKSFTPKRVHELRPRVEAIAGELIDQVESARQMELVADFAVPFPVRVIGELLGVPRPDQDRIGDWAHAVMPALEFLPMDPETLAKCNDATGEMAAYFSDLAAQRRAEPQDDLFTAMVHATDEEGVLSEEELVANAILMYIAGYETTAGASSLAVLALHRNPDQLERLKADPSLMPNAVEELLRYDAPGQATARIASEDVTFGGVGIPAGSGIVAYMGAANRDPEAYPDPDRLDITRPVEGLTSFGGGAHFCLGHALARQELDVALSTLLTRCPEMKLETLDPPFRPTALMRGVAEMPVRW